MVYAQQLRFSDSSTYQQQALPSASVSADSKDRSHVVQGLTVTPEGSRCTRFWKAKGVGKSKGYRYVYPYATWIEYETRYVSYQSLTGKEAQTSAPSLQYFLIRFVNRLKPRFPILLPPPRHVYTSSSLNFDHLSTPQDSSFLPLGFDRFPYDPSSRTFDSLSIRPLDRFSTPSYSPADARPICSSLVRVSRKSLNNGGNLRNL